ncbi:32412_t:CDS:2, partial [Gigaspora margarita]
YSNVSYRLLNNFLVKTDISNLNEDNYQEGFETDVEANAKFDKKGKGKKIKKKVVNLLKQFFLNRNINAKDKLTAQEMHLELKKFTQFKEIDDENIPQGTVVVLEAFRNSLN